MDRRQITDVEENVDVVRSEDAAEDPTVVRGGVNIVLRTRRIGTAAEGPVSVRGSITFDPGTRRVGTAAEGPVMVRGSINFDPVAVLAISVDPGHVNMTYRKFKCLVNPVDLKTAAVDPMIDALDVVRSMGSVDADEGKKLK